MRCDSLHRVGGSVARGLRCNLGASVRDAHRKSGGKTVENSLLGRELPGGQLSVVVLQLFRVQTTTNIQGPGSRSWPQRAKLAAPSMRHRISRQIPIVSTELQGSRLVGAYAQRHFRAPVQHGRARTCVRTRHTDKPATRTLMPPRLGASAQAFAPWPTYHTSRRELYEGF